MKAFIHDLNQALTYSLEGMYDAEKKLQQAIPGFSKNITSPDLKKALKSFGANRKDCRTKLKRIFSYLLAGPFQRKNTIMDQMIHEAALAFKLAPMNELKEVMFIEHLLTINHYQLSTYHQLKAKADFLELHAVSELLDEIITLQKETQHELIALCTITTRNVLQFEDERALAFEV
ncbi:MAG: DUF892 family protein [Bacteroidetes bacterium]|nr:DUF892 family protein [Bacteroidota bacterium]